MSVTVTDKGPNSCEIDFTAGETMAPIIAAVEAWIVLHGWEIFDAPHKVYRALCKNGTTYKYMKIESNTTNFMFRTFESWNATTHVGTNECLYANQLSAAAGTYSSMLVYVGSVTPANGGKMRLFATARYAMYSADNLTSTVVCKLNGICEWLQEVADAATPPFGFIWFNAIYGMLCYTGATAGGGYFSFSPVKIAGAVGNAITQLSCATLGTYEPMVSGTSVYYSLSGQLPSINDPVTNLPYSYGFKMFRGRNSNYNNTYIKEAYLGKLFGLKVIAGALSTWINGDTVTVSCDADNLQVNSGGSPVTHCISKYENTSSHYNAIAMPV